MTALKQAECTIEIGGFPISLHTEDEAFLDLLRRRYEGFLSSKPAGAALQVELDCPEGDLDRDIEVLRSGHEWLVQRGDFRATWDPVTRQGTVIQNRNPYSIDAVLRIVHSLILAESGGFLLHAASAICEGSAYLFSGVSGAGKTTMTRLAPPSAMLLTDEISYIRPVGEGYAAFGTPFAGELARVGENCSAPISALFFLEKGAENRIDELPDSDAVRRLMRNILFFANDSDLVEKIFATACDFIHRVRVRQLTFYPDSRVWQEVVNSGLEAVHA